MNTKDIIQHHGGASALARKLGYEKSNGAQRVHNWIERGIPARVILDNPALFDLSKLEEPKDPNAEQPATDSLASA